MTKFREPLIVEPVTLTGSTVVLEPLTVDHAAGLAKHAKPEFFALWPSLQPRSTDPDGMAHFVQQTLAMPNVLSLAITVQSQAVGMSSFMDIRHAHLGLEIGMTWISKDHQGTKVNPEAKLLMLTHAFEVLGCERVQLKTDLRNLQSQAAIEKLGANKEGILRQHMQMPDGNMRDTVMYSIVPSEWPHVKERLLARLSI